jgi:hypothetical protein
MGLDPELTRPGKTDRKSNTHHNTHHTTPNRRTNHQKEETHPPTPDKKGTEKGRKNKPDPDREGKGSRTRNRTGTGRDRGGGAGPGPEGHGPQAGPAPPARPSSGRNERRDSGPVGARRFGMRARSRAGRSRARRPRPAPGPLLPPRGLPASACPPPCRARKRAVAFLQTDCARGSRARHTLSHPWLRPAVRGPRPRPSTAPHPVSFVLRFAEGKGTRPSTQRIIRCIQLRASSTAPGTRRGRRAPCGSAGVRGPSIVLGSLSAPAPAQGGPGLRLRHVAGPPRSGPAIVAGPALPPSPLLGQGAVVVVPCAQQRHHNFPDHRETTDPFCP